MTNSEFSAQFDDLYNNITSNQAPGLDDREKSVFLTLAQEQLILVYYGEAGTNNISFEFTEDIRRYLSSLVKTKVVSPEESSGLVPLSKDSQIFSLPEKLWFITYEAAKLQSSDDNCTSGKSIEVVPVRQDEFHRINENPFKRASFRRALRLDISGNKVELVSKTPIESYLVRYLERPTPIILTDLSEYGSTIEGISEETPCALNECVHSAILKAAVALARQSMGKTFEKYQDNN